MKRFYRLIVLFIVIVIIFSGCTTLPTPSRMIKAPEATEQAMIVNDAESIVSKLLPKDGKLIAPKNSKGVSPIQRVDIDEDGREELLATYRVNGVKLEVVAVMFEENNGKWEEQWKISSPGYEFDRVEFADLTDLKKPELIVGVDSTGGPITSKGAKIFSMESGGPREIYSTLYGDMEVIRSDKASGEAGGDRLVFWIKPGPFGSSVDAYKLERINNEYILMTDSEEIHSFKKNVSSQYEAKMEMMDRFRNTWIYFYHYAYIMLKAGNPELALGAVENALDRVESNDTGAMVSSLLLKAKANNAVGNSKAAVEILEKALSESKRLEESELVPGYEALIYLEMSNSYSALNDTSNAETYNEKALEAGKRVCNSKAYENAAESPDKPFFKHYLKLESIEKDFKARFIYSLENR